MANNEIIQSTQSTAAREYMHGNQDAFLDMLAGEIGLSSLAVGEKFSSDDLVKADVIHLFAYDWVEYVESAGTPEERDVRFALWGVELREEDGTGDFKATRGYYQGGTVMNRLALAIEKNNAADDFARFGINIKCKWGKTRDKNKILLVEIEK